VFRGHDLHKDLWPIGWFDLYVFGITGRRLPAEQLQVLEAGWTLTSYPDARIWNNRVAALAGTTRSTPCLAQSAAQAVSEAMIYGRRNEFRAAAFYLRTHREMQAGATLDECIQRHLKVHGHVSGYGRPLASGDERIPPLMAFAKSLGVGDGPHVTLAFEVDRYFKERGRPLSLNYGGLVAAFAAEFGFSPRECNQFNFNTFLGGMAPCYTEAVEKPPGMVFPTACEDIAYEGVGKRAWPGGA